MDNIPSILSEYFPKVVPVITTTPIVIKFISWLRKLHFKSVAKKDNIEHLFGFLQEADFTTGNVPHDDVDSLQLFRNWFYKHFRNNRDIEYHRDLRLSNALVNIDKHLCSIGGPIDQLFTRYGMCYSKDGKGWDPVLPYIYPLKDVLSRVESEEKGATILRKWKGHEWKSVCWYIADRNGRRIFTPGTDRNGILNKDYFMLIIAPNTFTNIAVNQGQKHLMMAPAHGLAQLAVMKILDNDNILEGLNKKRQNYDYLQAIIEVPGKLTEYGYAPTGKFTLKRVEHLEAYEFEKVKSYKDWIGNK